VSLALVGGLALGQGHGERDKRTGKFIVQQNALNGGAATRCGERAEPFAQKGWEERPKGLGGESQKVQPFQNAHRKGFAETVGAQRGEAKKNNYKSYGIF